MHGLVNRAIQGFTIDTYGADTWTEVVTAGRLETAQFEAMLFYDEGQTISALDALADRLGRMRQDVIEDIGTYLVSHPNTQSLRRLLRFGGDTYADFLDSLDELPGRARMAVDDLVLPELDLRRLETGHYSLMVRSDVPGWGRLFVGILRAMADDYGALVMLEHDTPDTGAEAIDIKVVEAAFAEGRAFDLAQVG